MQDKTWYSILGLDAKPLFLQDDMLSIRSFNTSPFKILFQKLSASFTYLKNFCFQNSLLNVLLIFHFLFFRDEPLQFTLMGGHEKGFGIFIDKVEKGTKAAEIGLKRGKFKCFF